VDHSLLARCCGFDSDRSSGLIYACCTVCPEHRQARHKIVGNLGSKRGRNDLTNFDDPDFSVCSSPYTLRHKRPSEIVRKLRANSQTQIWKLVINNFFFSRQATIFFDTYSHIFIIIFFFRALDQRFVWIAYRCYAYPCLAIFILLCLIALVILTEGYRIWRGYAVA
jgi:hypothetical protein